MKIFDNILKRHLVEYSAFEKQKVKWENTKFDWISGNAVELDVEYLDEPRRNKGLDDILLYMKERNLQKVIFDFDDPGWCIKNPRINTLILDGFNSRYYGDSLVLDNNNVEKFYPARFSSEGRAMFKVYEGTSNSMKFYEIPTLNKILNLELSENILEWTEDDISFLKLSI